MSEAHVHRVLGESLVDRRDAGVNLHTGQMTMDLHGLTKDDFIDGLGAPMGAASFIDMTADPDITLFI